MIKTMAAVALTVLLTAGDDASKTVREAIDKVRAQKGCRVEFSSSMHLPGSDAMKLSGIAVVKNPDILYLNFTGSGEQKIRLIRKGEKALQLHPALGEWLDPLMVEGEENAGRGVYDVNAVLATLAKNLGEVRADGEGKVARTECLRWATTFSGEGIRRIMEEQDFDPAAIRWKDSTAEVTLWIGREDGLVHRFRVNATVIGDKGDLRGEKISYEADVTVTKYNDGLGLEEVPAEVKKRIGIAE